MFSGLVREIARVKSFTNNTLEIYTDYQAKLGDSIAINGACLTAIAFFQGGVTMELSNHTKQHIVTENFTPNAKVHLEPALSLGDRFDGHIVQGHIDGIGTISHITHNADSSDFFIQTNEATLELMIPKGSVCVDGISLTIVDSNTKGFKLTIIPHTLKHTLFGEYQIGRKVNIESDVITRSVVSTLRNMSRNSKNALSWRDIDMINLNY